MTRDTIYSYMFKRNWTKAFWGLVLLLVMKVFGDITNACLSYCTEEVIKKNFSYCYQKEINNEKDMKEETKIERKEIERNKNEKVSRGEVDRPEFDKQNVIAAIKKHLGGAFVNKAEHIYNTGKSNQVNPMLMAAISKFETSNGQSNICIKLNNPAGINRRPNQPFVGRYCKYSTLEAGIEDFAILLKTEYINKGFNSIDVIGKKFCPMSDKDNGKYGMNNSLWIPRVTTYYKAILADALNERG